MIRSITNTANPTITTEIAHGLAPGAKVEIRNAEGTPRVNGEWIVQTVPDAYSYTIPLATAPGVYTGNGLSIRPLNNAAEVTANIRRPDGTYMPERSLTGGQVVSVGDGYYTTTFDLEGAGDYLIVWRARSPVGEKVGSRVRIKANPLS